MKRSRRLVRVVVAPECLALVNRGDVCISNGLPSDVALRGVHFGADRGCFTIFLEHPDFEEVPEFDQIPLIEGPVFT